MFYYQWLVDVAKKYCDFLTFEYLVQEAASSQTILNSHLSGAKCQESETRKTKPAYLNHDPGFLYNILKQNRIKS